MVMSGGGGAYAAGGVAASTTRMVDQRGTLVNTDNPTDLAVTGRGFLPVATLSDVESENGQPTMRLATTGSFRTNADGVLTTAGGMVLMGWPTDTDGNIGNVPRDTSAGLEPVKFNMNQLSAVPTTQMRVGANLPATETAAGGTGNPHTLSIEYFDNLGRAESLTFEFTPTIPATGQSNEWTVTMTDSVDGTVVGEYTMTFEDNRTDGGNLSTVTAVTGGAYDPASGSVIVNVAGGPMEINIGQIGENDGFTQISDTFSPATNTKDGARAGNMIGVEVDEFGYVRAQYDTGATRTMFKVPLVDLPNPNGLTAMDQQTYLPSTDSGQFLLWEAGTGPTGEVAAYRREESATDVAGELTNMIQTQRAYSSNAKVIQTVDEMLQETTNIKR